MSGSDAPRSGKKTPESPARVELVCTGAELLSGHTTNTHARLLGEQLGPLGLALSRETSVPDQVSEIIAAVREARNRAEVVFVTGGLGPTSDDVTREALAELFGCGMVVDPVALTVIHERCARTGREPTPSRERQALILENATALANSAGLAPGEWIERPDGLLILLPGPPREFRAVLLEEVLPRLRNRFPNLAFRQAVFRICGLAESDLVEALQREGFDAGRAEFACCAGPGRLDIRIRAPLSAADDVDRTADLIRRIAGLQLVEESLRPMEEMLVERLRAAGKTIALAESCTGGLIGARLTTVPGCSEVFPGGLLAYSNTVKIEMLGVRPETLAAAGAVSAETAREMAVGARRQFRADIGLAVTGIAGPGGGTPEKPVGQVWIALSTEAGETAEFFRFAGTRDFIREGATQMALDLLRRALSESKPQKRRPGGEESFDSPPGFGYQ